MTNSYKHHDSKNDGKMEEINLISNEMNDSRLLKKANNY